VRIPKHLRRRWRDFEAARALVFIDVGEEGFAHEGDCLGVVRRAVLSVRGLGFSGTGGFVLQLLASEDELGVFEEELFPVQERLEDVWVGGGDRERGERVKRVERQKRLERVERWRYEIRNPKAEIRGKSEVRRPRWRGWAGRIGLRGSGGDLGAQVVWRTGWDGWDEWE